MASIDPARLRQFLCDLTQPYRDPHLSQASNAGLEKEVILAALAALPGASCRHVQVHGAITEGDQGYAPGTMCFSQAVALVYQGQQFNLDGVVDDEGLVELAKRRMEDDLCQVSPKLRHVVRDVDIIDTAYGEVEPATTELSHVLRARVLAECQAHALDQDCPCPVSGPRPTRL